MRALVLAGGLGTRLRPLTHTRSKQLLPIANEPVLFHGLRAIAHVGIRDVGIVVGDSSRAVREAVGDGSAFGIRATYVEQAEPLGLAHAVRISEPFLGDEDFVMYLGDNIIVGGIETFVDEYRRTRPAAQLLVTKVEDPRAFGVVQLDDNDQVLAVEEKPEHPSSDLALTGVYIFTPVVHEVIRGLRPSARGELEITDAISRLLQRDHPVGWSLNTDHWKDVGSIPEMLEANRLVLETLRARLDGDIDDHSDINGPVVVEAGAQIVRSTVTGPAIIGSGTSVRDSAVGPGTSIHHRCQIEDSAIEYSIVSSNASVRGVRRLEASLLGRHATVRSTSGARGRHTLVLGDHSTARIST